MIVLERGRVICGIDLKRPDLAGFDADICRALAAALFDNPAAVDARQLDWAAAAAALVSRQIDVYLGPTDRELPGIHRGPTLFVDATGAIARIDVGIRTIADLKFTTICLIQDSIDEAAFQAAADDARVQYQPVAFNAGDVDAMYSRYDQGHCDAVVDNRVRLAQRLPTLSAPREQALIDLALPTGLRGLLTASDDANWIDVVSAIGNSLIRAEQLGIVSSDLDTALASDDPAIRQLLGVEGDSGASLGLTADFAARAIAHVSHYGEIYDRHFGALPRGPNALVQDGGMISAP